MDEERACEDDKLFRDLTLPFEQVMPKEDFNRFCELALSMGLKLLKREMAEAKAKGRRAV